MLEFSPPYPPLPHALPTQVTNRCEALTKMSLIPWRYYEIHCLLPLGPEAQLPGLGYQPEAGPQQPQLPLSPAQVASCMARLSQGKGLYAVLSCSNLQRAPVLTTAAYI